MSILVTGANGFIGHHLITWLAPKGAQVAAAVRSMPEHKVTGVNYILCDLAAPDWTQRLSKSYSTVVHLAQSKRYREFPDGSHDMFDVNVRSTFELLEWARRKTVAHFIYASTGNVYKPSKEILDESFPCEPDSMYGTTKLAAESMVRQYQPFFQTTVLRIFGVYGPGQKNMLIPNIIANIRKKKKIFLSNGIGLRFTPLHVEDMIKMVEQVISHNRGTGHGCFNLCGNETVTLNEAVREIAKYIGLVPEVEISIGKEATFVGSNQKFKKTYGYQPEIDFSRGIRKMLQGSAG